MPFYRFGDIGFMHIKLSGKGAKNPPAPCAARIPNGSPVVGSTMRCCCISSFLCDWELGSGNTCDAPLCVDHAHEIGRDRRLCPEHAAERAEAQTGLF